MIIRPNNKVLACLFILFCIIACTRQADQGAATANVESTAMSYLTAFFHGDIQTAVGHMHPQSLNDLSTSFLGALDRAKESGQEAAFLAELGIKSDGDTLRRMKPDELYVTLVESDQQRDEKVSQAMKGLTVEVVSSTATDADNATVRMKIMNPPSDIPFAQEVGVSLLRHEGVWKVMGIAQ